MTTKKATTKKAAVKGPRCLVCGGQHTRILRGLCPRCYGGAGRLIRAGETSWEKLEAQGRAAPSARRRYSNPLCVAVMQDRDNDAATH